MQATPILTASHRILSSVARLSIFKMEQKIPKISLQLSSLSVILGRGHSKSLYQYSVVRTIYTRHCYREFWVGDAVLLNSSSSMAMPKNFHYIWDYYFTGFWRNWNGKMISHVCRALNGIVWLAMMMMLVVRQIISISQVCPQMQFLLFAPSRT